VINSSIHSLVSIQSIQQKKKKGTLMKIGWALKMAGISKTKFKKFKKKELTMRNEEVNQLK